MDIFNDNFQISKAFQISWSLKVLSSYLDQYAKWEYLYFKKTMWINTS